MNLMHNRRRGKLRREEVIAPSVCAFVVVSPVSESGGASRPAIVSFAFQAFRGSLTADVTLS
jgi:hypothetical protein